MSQDREMWRPVVGYEGFYAVSSWGRVASLHFRNGNTNKPRYVMLILKPGFGKLGHAHLALVLNNVKRQVGVHRVVLEAFVGPCPPGHQGAHWDGNPTNNRLDNLRWATVEENRSDMIRHGTAPRGEQNPFSLLTTAAVVRIRKLAAIGLRHGEIADLVGISRVQVQRVATGRAWKHADGPIQTPHQYKRRG